MNWYPALVEHGIAEIGTSVSDGKTHHNNESMVLLLIYF